jgi:hypothetical protein
VNGNTVLIFPPDYNQNTKIQGGRTAKGYTGVRDTGKTRQIKAITAS